MAKIVQVDAADLVRVLKLAPNMRDLYNEDLSSVLRLAGKAAKAFEPSAPKKLTVRIIWSDGNKIAAIKAARAMFGHSLIDAKNIIEGDCIVGHVYDNEVDKIDAYKYGARERGVQVVFK